MKKRLLALALVLVMLFGLAACGSKAPEVGEEEKKDVPDVLTIGEYEAKYKGFKILPDSDGEDAIAIYLDFTNNSDEAKGFTWAMYPEVTQNGTDMEYAVIFVDEESYECLDENSLNDAQPGETIEIILTYKLADPEAKITIACSDLMEENTDELTIDPTGKQLGEKTEDSSKAPEENVEQKGYAFDDGIASAYAGDWHGVAEFYECTGDYSDEDGMQCDIAARLVFDEDGCCTPYIRLCLDQPEEENLIVESLSYDEEYDCILINGTLNGKPLDPVESFIELESEDVLYIGAEYDDGSGDVFKVLGCLRRLDDTWDYENDYPYIVQEGVDFYMGMSFEERIELFGYDTSLIPELSGNVVSDDEEEEPAEDAGEGVVELQQLKDWKAWHKEINSNANNYYKPTIDECVEEMGVEPAAWNVEKWEEDVQMFKWTTPDGKDHIILTIKPDDSGTWRYHSISWSPGVNG